MSAGFTRKYCFLFLLVILGKVIFKRKRDQQAEERGLLDSETILYDTSMVDICYLSKAVE
jgi:hypothetical protein